MRNRMIMGLGLLLLLLGPAAAAAQEEWVEAEVEKANLLIEQEAYARAVQVLEKALARAEREFAIDHFAVGFIASELANAYLFVDDVGKASALMKKMLARYEAAGGPSDPRLGETHLELANIYDSAGNEKEARTHYQKAVAVFKQHMAEDDPFLLDLMSYMKEMGEGTEVPEPDEDVVVIREGAKPEVRVKTAGIETTRAEAGKERTPRVRTEPEPKTKPPARVEPETPRGKQPHSREGFVVQTVDCPRSFAVSSEGGKPGLPTMTVTYQISTSKAKVEWDQRFEVIGPGGEVGDAGGGRQWYSTERHGRNPTYEVKGYSLLRKPGVYRFKLTLTGEGLTPVVVEREFMLK